MVYALTKTLNYDHFFTSISFLKLNFRFYCAAAVDNRTRLDFHGEPRIWDGHFIKRKIKGNSALYIFTDEVKMLFACNASLRQV